MVRWGGGGCCVGVGGGRVAASINRAWSLSAKCCNLFYYPPRVYVWKPLVGASIRGENTNRSRKRNLHRVADVAVEGDREREGEEGRKGMGRKCIDVRKNKGSFRSSSLLTLRFCRRFAIPFLPLRPLRGKSGLIFLSIVCWFTRRRTSTDVK